MKRLVTSEAKQGEATKYCAMLALVATPSHSGHSGEVGTSRRLVKCFKSQLCYVLAPNPLLENSSLKQKCHCPFGSIQKSKLVMIKT
jgi:hypothetical protein